MEFYTYNSDEYNYNSDEYNRLLAALSPEVRRDFEASDRAEIGSGVSVILKELWFALNDGLDEYTK